MSLLIPIIVFLILPEFALSLFTSCDEHRKAFVQFNYQVIPPRLYTRLYKPGLRDVIKCQWREDGADINATSKLFTDRAGHTTVSYPDKQQLLGKNIIFAGGLTTESQDMDEEKRFPLLTGNILKCSSIFAGHTTYSWSS